VVGTGASVVGALAGGAGAWVVGAALVAGATVAGTVVAECGLIGSESGARLAGACDIRATAVVDRTRVKVPATPQDEIALTRLLRCPRTQT
jgi:hypothetical protein